MNFKPVILWTDLLFLSLIVASIVFFFHARQKRHWRIAWQSIINRPLSLMAIMILAVYFLIGALDSLHYQIPISDNHYSPKVYSLLDTVISPIGKYYEKTYSAPFALTLYVKETQILPNGQVRHEYPRLQYAALTVKTSIQRNEQVRRLSSYALFQSFFYFSLFAFLLLLYHSHHTKKSLLLSTKNIFYGETNFPMRTFLFTLFFLILIVNLFLTLGHHYHIFGTDKVGQDVFYQTIKSIRTGLVIGTLATIIMLPFAILFGLFAGYFGGMLDDAIQYTYTTLSAIPGVLLIAAAVLSLQVYISTHADLFPILDQRADARLLALCAILGVTSWTSLCRLLRAETMKLREADYVQAAIAVGTHHRRVLVRHILPNIMHIVFIAIAIDFSTLVLAEAVLSYVGVGVSPVTISWGNMINSARLELARDPIVWWPMLAAFIFMFVLVLAANLFSDALRDAFDPRMRQQS